MIAMPVIVALALGALCVAIIYMDLRYMRIPDWISIAVVALFAVWVVFDGASIPIVARLIAAVVVFAICFALFAARIMGGGDTKVVPALTLFIPLTAMSSIMFLFAVCLFASIALVVAARKLLSRGQGSWVVLSSHKLPMGVAIGSTGVIGLLASQL